MASPRDPPTPPPSTPPTGFLSLDAQLANYRAYHRHPVNVAIHAVCVPAIVVTSLIFLHSLPLPLPAAAVRAAAAALPPAAAAVAPAPTAASAVVALYTLYYLSLDVRIGAAAAVFLVAMAAAAQAYVSATSATAAGGAAAAAAAAAAGPAAVLLGDDLWRGALRPALRAPALVWVAGWAAQFVGHGVFEGRRPALVDGFVDAVATAPLFVFIEWVLLVGGWPALRRRLEGLEAAEGGKAAKAD